MQAYPHGTVSLVIDCAELDRASAFWCGVLGYRPVGQWTEST
jgi:catechol 2,3-dioxygenase-like lactoylglutathione lyase family enzyme